jgi:hypothetical protein
MSNLSDRPVIYQSIQDDADALFCANHLAGYLERRTAGHVPGCSCELCLARKSALWLAWDLVDASD